MRNGCGKSFEEIINLLRTFGLIYDRIAAIKPGEGVR